MVQKKINIKNLILNNINFKGKKHLSENKLKYFFKNFNKTYKKRFTKYFYIFLNYISLVLDFNNTIKNFLSFNHRINYTLKYFVKNNKFDFIFNLKTSFFNKILSYKKILLFYRW